MKKLLLVLAGLSVATNVFAADDTQWKHAGEIRVRHKNTTNKTASKKPKLATNENLWEQRTTLGITGTQGENLVGHVKLLAAGEWGLEATAGEDDIANKKINTNGGDNSVALLEGYIWWKSSDMFSLRFGRGGFTLADGSVVSTNDYDQIPKVFEGVLGTFDFGFAGLNVFGVKGAELEQSATNAHDLAYDKEQVFYGVSMDFKNLPDFLKMANIHLIQENQDINYQDTGATNTVAAGSEGKSLMRYGFTLGGDTTGLDYKATYAGMTGKTRPSYDKTADIKLEASMIDAALGYTFAEAMNTRIGVIYHTDTGDKDDDAKTNKTYDPFHYNKHDNAGAMDLVTWGNLTYIGGGVKSDLLEKTTFGVDFFAFSRTSNKTEVTVSGITHTGGTENKKSDIGSEIDIWAKHKYNDNFDMGFRYSMFTPGEYLKNNTVANALTKVERDGISQWWLSSSLRF